MSDVAAEHAYLASPVAMGEHLGRGKYIRAPHLTLLSNAIVDLVFDRGRPGSATGLIVCMPPRHGKSTTTTLWTPTWFEAIFPDRMVGLGCYGDDYARDWGRKVRNNLKQLYPFLQVNVAQDSKAADEWHTMEGGGMISSGIGGEFTGRGFHLLIIDDPDKNAKEAQSETVQRAKWEWWLSTARTRLEPGGVWVLVLTRWDENDLAGKLIAANKAGPGADGYDPIKVISLPALAETRDELGREPGDALWPFRYSAEDLTALKSSVGSYWWSAQYQQRPTPAEGGVIKRKWWQRYDAIPGKFDQVVCSWDLAMKDLADNDYTVGLVVGRVGSQFYVLDCVRDRMDAPAQLRAVKDLARRWPQAIAKLVEDKANGPAVIALLRMEVPGLIPIKADASTGGKQARLMAVSPLIEAKNVFVPEGRSWADDIINEAGSFPLGATDDLCDALSQALNWMMAAAYMHTPDPAPDTRTPDEQHRAAIWERIRAEQNPQEDVQGPARYGGAW
jgi:predicted phage terminase large subunit-like protein